MKGNAKDTEENLTNIFKRAGVDFKQNTPLKSENVFGVKINLYARDMLIVFFWIESVFKIRIPEEEIVKGEFNTFEQIMGVINRCRGIE